MIYFTADTHFGHKNMIRYSARPFPDVHTMNVVMTEEWNNIVKEDDIIYHLGDFSMCGVKATRNILEQLNGKKYLCVGSHDKSTLKCKEYFEDVKESMFISIYGQGIFLAHHCHKVWPKSHYGSWHLFGHSHGGLDGYAVREGKLLDVGVDSHNFKPWSFEEIKNVMVDRPDNFNLVKNRLDK